MSQLNDYSINSKLRGNTHYFILFKQFPCLFSCVFNFRRDLLDLYNGIIQYDTTSLVKMLIFHSFQEKFS